ncbi:MAG: PHB depolymerase family esterase [Candidatus Omnitrophota bacterium]|nr:PHB depolymerase family esterase [Candidatus Omnitrophota bacterium]
MTRRALLAFAVSLGVAGGLGPGVYAAQACGDGVCDAGETKQNCPQDCRPLLKLLRQRRAGRAARPSASETSTLGAGDSRGSLTVDGRKRTYLLHRPASYSPAKRYPLVLVFHGGGGAGAKIAKQTGFSDYADQEGFIAAYPDGIEHNWNDGRGTTDAERLHVDDVAFVKALLARLQQELSIDPQRIYATGPSNGGIFTYRLGCEMAGVFAAIAPVIGNLAEPMAARCAPAEPLSVLAINGDADPLIPIQGGECCKRGDGGRLLSTEASLGIFLHRNGCATTPVRAFLPTLVEDGTTVEHYTYPGCAHQTEVIWYLVHGMGHGWPPKPPQARRIAGPTSHNIDATQVIWEFFKRHPKQHDVGGQ